MPKRITVTCTERDESYVYRYACTIRRNPSWHGNVAIAGGHTAADAVAKALEHARFYIRCERESLYGVSP